MRGKRAKEIRRVAMKLPVRRPHDGRIVFPYRALKRWYMREGKLLPQFRTSSGVIHAGKNWK